MPFIFAMLHFTGAWLLMVVVNWSGMMAWRRSTTAHWTERARLLWPVRITARFNVFLLPFFLLFGHALWQAQNIVMLWVTGLAGFLGALLGCYPCEHEMFPRLNFRNWCYQVMVAWGLRFGIWIIFFSAMILMPDQAGWGLVSVAASFLTLHFLIQFGLFLKCLRLIKFMTPAGPHLQQIVQDVTTRMAVQVRATWQVGGTMANAFALPTTSELIFTNRLLEVCTAAELGAICAHELGHLTESKDIRTGRLLGSLSFFPLIFVNPAMYYWGLPGALLLFVEMWAISQFTRRLRQRMEKRADKLALQEQAQAGVYASALEKLYRANQVPAVLTSKNTIHPHLYDRILAAGLTPDYPRPLKPQKFTWAGWLVLISLGVLVAFQVTSHWGGR